MRSTLGTSNEDCNLIVQPFPVQTRWWCCPQVCAHWSFTPWRTITYQHLNWYVMLKVTDKTKYIYQWKKICMTSDSFWRTIMLSVCTLFSCLKQGKHEKTTNQSRTDMWGSDTNLQFVAEETAIKKCNDQNTGQTLLRFGSSYSYPTNFVILVFLKKRWRVQWRIEFTICEKHEAYSNRDDNHDTCSDCNTVRTRQWYSQNCLQIEVLVSKNISWGQPPITHSNDHIITEIKTSISLSN